MPIILLYRKHISIVFTLRAWGLGISIALGCEQYGPIAQLAIGPFAINLISSDSEWGRDEEGPAPS